MPVAGRVLRILQDSEAMVAAGTALLEVGDPADLELVVDVLTTEAVGIRPGAPMAIERWGGPVPLEGRVWRVESGSFTKVSALCGDEQRVWVVIDLLSPRERWAALGEGFRVDARITVEAIKDAMLVPVSALFRRGEGWRCSSCRTARRVEVARRGARSAMISGGVAASETVVLFPPRTLRNGVRVSHTR